MSPAPNCPSIVWCTVLDRGVSANCTQLVTLSWAFSTGRGREKHRAGGMIGWLHVVVRGSCPLTGPLSVASQSLVIPLQQLLPGLGLNLACSFSNISRNSLKLPSNLQPHLTSTLPTKLLAMPVWGCLGFLHFLAPGLVATSQRSYFQGTQSGFQSPN